MPLQPTEVTVLNSEKWTSWLAIVSNFGILLGLGLVVWELRQNDEALRTQQRIALSEVYAARNATAMEFRWRIIESDALSQALTKVQQAAKNDLSPEEIVGQLPARERSLLLNYMTNLMLQQDNNLYQAELGLLDEQTLRASKSVIKDYWEIWAAFRISPTRRVESTYADLQKLQTE
jgi:hypothetical protein